MIGLLKMHSYVCIDCMYIQSIVENAIVMYTHIITIIAPPTEQAVLTSPAHTQ